MQLPLFHPTMVVFLDDNKLLLRALQLEFGDVNRIYTTDVNEALRLLNSSYDSLLDDIIKNDSRDDASPTSYTFDFENLLAALYDENRYKIPSVLVIDHSMPQMTGIEFCKKVQHLPCKKIILTGHGSLDTAVQAFNDGIIDYFLKKEGEDLSDKINTVINRMQHEFFEDISNSLLKYMGSLFQQSDAYQELWRNVKESSIVSEYYLLDESGSYLFVDEAKNFHWLMVREQKLINEYADIAEGFDANEDLLVALREHKAFPYFLTKTDADASPDEWQNYLQPCQPLGDGLYYAVASGKITSDQDWDRLKF